MANPIENRAASGKIAGTVKQENIANSDLGKAKIGYNTFDLSNHLFTTNRYGEITPYLTLEAVPGDHFKIRTSHNLHTFTLQSPLMNKVRMHQDLFAVPMKSIMPETWDLLIADPKKGDDIPEDAKPEFSIVGLYGKLYEIITDDVTYPVNTPEGADLVLKAILLMTKVFSNGVLLDNMNYHFPFSEQVNAALDVWASELASSSTSITVRYPKPDGGTEDRQFVFTSVDLSQSRKEFFDLLYLQEEWVFRSVTGSVLSQLRTAFSDMLINIVDEVGVVPSDYPNINIAKLLAYQQICVQFYSNDTVDWIFDSEAYMDVLRNYATEGMAISATQFRYNGLKRTYDLISKHMLDLQTERLSNKAHIDQVRAAYYFFSNIFDVRHSLKYGDYFTSARTRPLAVGDVKIGVDTSTMTVDALDVTRNLSIQRFLNAVNRAPGAISSYFNTIFGETPTEVAPMPHFIGHDTSIIGKDATTNTSNDQGKVTAQLASSDSKYAYDVKFKGEFAIVMGLVSYDAEFAYPATISRDWTHTDRYEFYNPFMQQVGDQPVYSWELNSFSGAYPQLKHGYDQRYSEYKRNYSYVAGGFLSKNATNQYSNGLSTWLFIPDDTEAVDWSGKSALNPEFIRSVPSDFDKFYGSLTGTNLRDYYHFIVDFSNEVVANRKMQYEPGILL